MTEGGQLPVRHDPELTRELPELGDAEPDRLDDARVWPDLDHVPDSDQVLEQDEEAHDDVADQALRPEADRDTDHPRRHEDRSDVDADLLQDDDTDQERHEVAGHARKEGTKGLSALGPGRVLGRPRERPQQPADQDRDEAVPQPADQHYARDGRDPGQDMRRLLAERQRPCRQQGELLEE